MSHKSTITERAFFLAAFHIGIAPISSCKKGSPSAVFFLRRVGQTRLAPRRGPLPDRGVAMAHAVMSEGFLFCFLSIFSYLYQMPVG